MYPQNAPYPPQQPQMPYAPQGYPPQAPAGYPYPQQYGQPGAPVQPPVPQGPPAAKGTVAGFFNQPVGGGGPGFKFPVLGTTYSGVIARDVTDADVTQQTDFQTGQITPACFYRDGRPKLQMCIPIRLSTGPSAEFPEGTGAWYVKGGADQQELVRAMTAAGAVPDENGVLWPKAGDPISITYTHDKPGRAGMNPAKIKSVQYQVGNGQAPAAPVAAPVQQPVQQAPVQPQVQQYVPTPQPQVMQPVQYQNTQLPVPEYAPTPVLQAGPVQYTNPAPGVVAQPVQPQAAPQIPGLTPQQAALVAQQIQAQQQG
jgi:hypothetical protein